MHHESRDKTSHCDSVTQCEVLSMTVYLVYVKLVSTVWISEIKSLRLLLPAHCNVDKHWECQLRDRELLKCDG